MSNSSKEAPARVGKIEALTVSVALTFCAAVGINNPNPTEQSVASAPLLDAPAVLVEPQKEELDWFDSKPGVPQKIVDPFRFSNS